MKRINLNGAWPILIPIVLFLILPFSTLPGLFDAVFIALMGIAAALAVLIVAALIQSRRRDQATDLKMPPAPTEDAQAPNS
ncbi:MAG: hypothetical protein ACK4JD_12240 [Thermoflexales bacterium]